MTFREAVEATPSVSTQFRRGLQALPNGHAACIRYRNARKLAGSLNLDVALQMTHPNASRWDYGIGFDGGEGEVAIWVEVHPASSTGISDMLAKLNWLKNWLETEAAALRGLTHGQYHWISTDATIAITPNSQHAKRLALAGLRGPTRVLNLE